MGNVTELQAAIAKAMRVVPGTDDEGMAESDRRTMRTNRSNRIWRSGCRLPDADRKAILDGTIEQRHATRAVREWFEDPKRTAVLIISGITGSGKTMSIGAIAADNDVHYVGAEDLCRIFSANFGEQLSKQELIRDTKNLLAIDEVGTETDETRMLSTLLEIFNARVSESETPTVIATNLPRKAFGDRYGNMRIVSRMARVTWVDVQGDDMRRRKK